MLIHKQHVMLEACIQVRFEAKVDDDRIVVAVDMGVHAVHALEDLEEERLERLREGYAWWLSAAHQNKYREDVDEHTNSAREHLLIVYIALHPRHQMLNVLRCRHLCWLLEVLVVLPQILEFVRGLHLWTALRTAEFRNRAVEEVDLVVEIDDC